MHKMANPLEHRSEVTPSLCAPLLSLRMGRGWYRAHGTLHFACGIREVASVLGHLFGVTPKPCVVSHSHRTGHISYRAHGTTHFAFGMCEVTSPSDGLLKAT